MPTTVPPLALLHLLQKRILIVDNSPTMLEFLTKVLRPRGYRVVTAGNGQEGLARFHRGVFDLVLTDYDMPLMNGEEMAVAIKTMAPEVPIIMISGQDGALSNVLPHGVDYFILKPCSVTQLYDAVALVLEVYAAAGNGEQARQLAGSLPRNQARS